jgi:hypothetical protein
MNEAFHSNGGTKKYVFYLVVASAVGHVGLHTVDAPY